MLGRSVSLIAGSVGVPPEVGEFAGWMVLTAYSPQASVGIADGQACVSWPSFTVVAGLVQRIARVREPVRVDDGMQPRYVR